MRNRTVNFWVSLVVIFAADNIVWGNPTGGTVRSGSATFNSSGSQLTITTSQNAFINWQSFNIGLGQTTTFVQPSSSSLVWNQISDSSPSQILGSLNANGYVVLQNQSGFYIGGQAAISAHGLILTTTPLAVPDLSSSGPWSFSAPPPTARIVNYGQINVRGGGSAFLIANDIENNGSITAPGGNIGLYSGEQVLVSTRPDGRGLSANVTLPAGSVDNSGNLIADGGSIAMQAKVVNQGGVVRANTVTSHNGIIQLVASDAVNLDANSVISAQGDSTGVSSGGAVTIKSGGTFSDQSGSTINIAGGANGGNGGQLEISAPSLGAIQSQISAGAAKGFHGGTLTLDPTELDVNAAYVSTLTPILNSGIYQLNLQADDTITMDTLWTLSDPGGPALLTLTAGNNIVFNDGTGIAGGNNWSVSLFAGPQNLANAIATSGNNGVYFNGNSFIQTQNGNINIWAANEVMMNTTAGSAYTGYANGVLTSGGNINVTAGLGNIELGTLLTLPALTAPASINIAAGNSINFDDGSQTFAGFNGIQAGKNWSVNLTAGPQNLTTKPTTADTDGVYLNGASYVQTQNGDINVLAANEVILSDPNTYGTFDGTGIRTTQGGNINVTAQLGDVNTGGDAAGFNYHQTAPYYTVSPSVGGISTAAGGNVTITAGGNVTSYLPQGTGLTLSDPNISDGGTGAFGSKPGDVTITAGGSVYGHYVVADGIGTITAGRDIGAQNNPFALSLIDGSWSANAPNGNIYLQEVRNPNGIFNEVGNVIGSARAPGAHLFNYDPESSVSLDAGIGVYLTGTDSTVPRMGGGTTAPAPIPIIYPPTLNIIAGSGGVSLADSVVLFPSPDQNLNITTTGGGGLQGVIGPNGASELLMSDSSQTRWTSPLNPGGIVVSGTFGDTDHGALTGIDNFEPVTLNISGDMQNLTLLTTKATEITVDGNMDNVNFSGQNLHADDITSIHVGGQIFYSSPLTFVPLPGAIPALPANALPNGLANNWDSIFQLLMDPSIANYAIPANTLPSDLAGLADRTFGLFPVQQGTLISNPGFLYSPTTLQLGYNGPMFANVLAAFTQPLTVLVYQNGFPVTTTQNGVTHFVTETVNWAAAAQVAALYTDSQGALQKNSSQYGLHLGGPGQFDVSAGSITLGDSAGIWATGVSDGGGSGASGFGRYGNLAPLTPSGADLNVTIAGNLQMQTSTIADIGGGNLTVTSTGGSMDLGTQQTFDPAHPVDFGVYTTGPGNVTVIASGNINVDGSRIGAFDGGNVFVESLQGNVDAGTGGASQFQVESTFVDPATGLGGTYSEKIFGSGIIANTLVNPSQVPGAAVQPGNITVETPRGDIDANAGGIIQEALNGNVAPGPTVTLSAGTFASGGSPGYVGNIDLGASGVIGGTVNATANGNITGLIISRQNSDINAAQTFSGTVLSGGSANLSASSVSASTTVIGVGGVSVSGNIASGATFLGQVVSANGGQATSTLGTSAGPSSTATSASGDANLQANAQVADNGDSQDDPNKKKGKGPGLTRRTSRVTVILPKS